MAATLEIGLIGLAVLLLLSVLASRLSDRFGIPALLLFLALGMLAGSDGPGGIYFDDPALAQSVGIVALIFILFSGGLDTRWSSVRPVFKHGLGLATLGVFLTALIVGLCASWVLGMSLESGILLGAIVSSTDAAAVFSILRSRGVNLKGRLKDLLELESGSNDPMAVFLTIGMIRLLTAPETHPSSLVVMFLLQMAIGAGVGYAAGMLLPRLANRLRLGAEGLYPVLSLSLVLLAYGLATLLGGNGFLAVYLAGILAGNQDFIHKRSLARFHDGLAWVMQIMMFLTLGLLVFPSELGAVAGVGLLVAAVLVLVARPVSVFLVLLPARFSLPEKALVAWVGLRGAVPIILATYPLLARLPEADMIFNVVFFVVLTSVLVQGTTIPQAARLLKLDEPAAGRRVYPIEYNPSAGWAGDLKELHVLPGSFADGKAIVELGLPEGLLVVLIARRDGYLLPSGGAGLLAGDTLLVLADAASFQAAATLFQVQAAGEDH